ncbi:MAG: patatin-like phospholipase family protein [Alphaproteobacteria bacterium]|nr:patatin-like phospholipase family protein [Alphaproteobacteria bacterium]
MKSSCGPFLSFFLFVFLGLIYVNTVFGEGGSTDKSNDNSSNDHRSTSSSDPILAMHDVSYKDTFLTSSSLDESLNIMDKEPRKIFLLSLSGGGFRGIIHAYALSRLESLFGTSVVNIFNGVSGTSTGALVAFGIGIPDPERPGVPLYSANDVLKLYLDERERIFQKPGLSQRIWSAKGFWGPKYSIIGMEASFKDSYKSYRMSDLLIPTFVPAVEVLQGNGAKIFSSTKARHNDAKDYLIWQVARATTAAPSFFESKEMHDDASGNDQESILNFWDGGLFAHNPAEIALIEGQKMFPDKRLKDFILLSIGTGEEKCKINQEMTQKMGYGNGGGQIFKATMAAQNSWVHKKLKKQLKDNYIRLDVNLDEEGVELDNITTDYIEKLYFATEKMLDEATEQMLHLKDVWEIQKGKKKSNYDLFSALQLFISNRYSIPLENKKAIHTIYQEYCEEHHLNCGYPKDIKKVIMHMSRSSTDAAD